MRRFALALIASISLAASAGAQGDAKPDDKRVDITGKWSFTVQSPAGTGTPTVTFKQKADTISGTYISNALGERTFNGWLKDGAIKFAFEAESGGQAFLMSFSGTLDGKDAMKGTIDFSGMATGSFTGKRQPATPNP
jgi:hypothetical protein